MAIGPLSPYLPAGVYSRTLNESNVAALLAGVRIPVIVGVGQEELDQLDLEMVRGSNSTLDQLVVNEDATLSWIVDDTNPSNPILGVNDGTLLRLKVRNSPIVTGDGDATTTNDARRVTVTVDGVPVSVGQVRGARGEVILQIPPPEGSVVRVTYYFHRGDTLFTDDLSDQVTSKVAILTSPGYAPFSTVAGTTDTFKLKINGGSEKTVVFAASPAVKAQTTLPGATINGGVTYTAVASGTAGNAIRVRHVVAGNSTPLSIVVSGNDITVNSATDGGGLVTSTATQVVAAITGSGAASALVTSVVTGNGSGLIAAASYTNLTGGVDAASAASLKTQIDAASLTGLTTTVYTGPDGKDHLRFSADVSLEITTGNANGVLGFSNSTKTTRNATFMVFNRPIVDGTSGGITTTDPSKVVVKVNGTQVIPTSVDGKNGLVTLASPPSQGASVVVSYYGNTWQDTYDQLPNTLVTNVLRAGISPNRSDYLQGQDFVVSNPSSDVSIIHWGTSFSVSSATVSPGSEPFDESQIVPTLVDDKMYLGVCSRFVDTTSIPAVTSSNTFVLPAIPTLGNGRDTPLTQATFNAVTAGKSAVPSNRPDLIEVRVGRDLADALGRPAAKVLSVDSTTRKIVLKDAVAPDHTAFATFWYNRIVDDTYVLTCVTPGPVGSGQYEVFSTVTNSNLFQVSFGSKSVSLTDTVVWPRGVEQVPDAFHFGGAPVSETVRVTFGQSAATKAEFTSDGAAPYSFYSPSSATWRSALNGAGTVSTNLAVATQAYLVSKAVKLTSGNITIGSGAMAFEITIDGTPISVTLTPGSRTPSQIATEVNTAIDANAAFIGTAPNNLFTPIPTSGSEVYFVIRSFSTPASLPGGFDHKATAAIRQGTAEASLGYTTFQSASGTTGAVNKAATLLGTKAGPFVWTAGVNDKLKVRVNGVDYTITIQTASTATSAVVADINGVIPSTVGAASVGTLGNLDKLRLTSALSSDQSSVLILDGTANEVLGLNQGDFAGQTKVSAQEVVDRLMDTVNFAVTSWSGTPAVNSSGAVAYPLTVDAQTYVKIDSLTTGTSSSVAFVDGANSAFNATGVDITPGTDGDNGSAAYNSYTVTSTNPEGSAGTGVPGQTYTDAVTGLRFTVLGATDGSYTSGGWFELQVSSTFKVSPSVPSYAVPGLELLVSNTVNVFDNDTASLQTFNPSGVEPKNGDFYFISYRYLKQDFGTRIFRQFKTIEANYGKLSAENRVTLGAYLAILNGAVLVGISQVRKTANTNTAPASAFIQAITDLATPLPGNIKPDVIVPLSSDTSVYSFLTQHCEIMANIRNQSERMGFIGFASGTTPSAAQTIARSLLSQRIVAFYPDSGVVTLTDELGQSYENLVDGTFFAAAAAGMACSPAVDVATPYTHRRIQGYTRIPRILDAVEANQTAVAGVTLLEDLDPVIRIRQGFTTNMSSLLTRLPTVTQIADYTSQQTRGVLDAFVGTKFLASRVSEVEVSMTSLFKQLVQQDIIGNFTGISAAVDDVDATTLRAEAYYQPIFPLLYLILTFNLRSKI